MPKKVCRVCGAEILSDRHGARAYHMRKAHSTPRAGAPPDPPVPPPPDAAEPTMSQQVIQAINTMATNQQQMGQALTTLAQNVQQLSAMLAQAKQRAESQMAQERGQPIAAQSDGQGPAVGGGGGGRPDWGQIAEQAAPALINKILGGGGGNPATNLDGLNALLAGLRPIFGFGAELEEAGYRRALNTLRYATLSGIKPEAVITAMEKEQQERSALPPAQPKVS